MKKKIFFAGIFLSIFLYECVSQKPAVVTYDVPTTLTGNDKEDFIKQCEKGKILYKLYCTKCHGIFTKGKDSIPNFSKQELAMYRMKNLKQNTENHEIAKNISYEQLNMVILFLQYRKK